MTSLFYAVYHGCQAEQYQKTLDEIYYERIQRRKGFYLTKRRGAYGTNLSLLANFFHLPWTEPVSEVSRGDQSWLIGEAALSLQAIGRLSEALKPLRITGERRVEEEDWPNASIDYRNVAALAIALGDLTEAAAAARQAIELADRSDDAYGRIASKVYLAACLHQFGTSAECSRLFDEAERIHRESQPEFPMLYSLVGYLYNDFLLDLGQVAEVLRRATKTLQWAEAAGLLLPVGLDHVSLGRAYAPGSPE